MNNRIVNIFLIVTAVLAAAGCSWFDNQTAYFNTHYNMQRIMTEIKDEFSYIDENRRVQPRVLVPGLDSAKTEKDEPKTRAGYQFLKAFVIDRAKLQPVNTKVDSILLKGSKILANHPKSEFVESSLFLMAEAYFFRQEWMPSQQKCIELIERFTDGELSPDAHLLLAKNYLMQRKVSQGKQTLSRTIDVAWYKDRFDILSEAYRIQAEMAMEDGDLEGAVQPYKQAIAQIEDDEVRAKWQVDVASLYYRQGRFELAEQAFARVFNFTPDILAEFEALLYRGSSLVKLGRTEEAEEIFTSIERNKNYADWISFVTAEKLALQRRKSSSLNDSTLIAQERVADTSFVGRPELMAQSFQKGMSLYKENNYQEAIKYFAKAKVVRTPVYEVASKYFTLLKQWDDQHRKVNGYNAVLIERESFRDSIMSMKARELYALGRVHEQLGNIDSALFYYRYSYDSTSDADNDRSKYLYSQARLLAPSDPDAADSLYMVLNEKYPKSIYGKEASDNLGFTAEAAIDDAAEMYRSGMSFRKIRDFDYASKQFNEVAARFESSQFAAKSLYALGWMFERDLNEQDSALFYYGLLMERYPRSEYAKEVRPSVEYALAKRNNSEVNDSLLFKDLDEDLLRRARASERSVLDQVIDKNKNALDVKVPGLNLPSIPGLTPPGGGNINDLIKNQVKSLGTSIRPADSARVPLQDTSQVRKP
ncbi:MAG: tetratricopeptide repeat protein [Ignavibacteria bacterium]|nr:tetratricopeptide repeat protein [Ignavibacteria bacterium]